MSKWSLLCWECTFGEMDLKPAKKLLCANQPIYSREQKRAFTSRWMYSIMRIRQRHTHARVFLSLSVLTLSLSNGARLWAALIGKRRSKWSAWGLAPWKIWSTLANRELTMYLLFCSAIEIPLPNRPGPISINDLIWRNRSSPTTMHEEPEKSAAAANAHKDCFIILLVLLYEG